MDVLLRNLTHGYISYKKYNVGKEKISVDLAALVMKRQFMGLEKMVCRRKIHLIPLSACLCDLVPHLSIIYFSCQVANILPIYIHLFIFYRSFYHGQVQDVLSFVFFRAHMVTILREDSSHVFCALATFVNARKIASLIPSIHVPVHTLGQTPPVRKRESMKWWNGGAIVHMAVVHLGISRPHKSNLNR